MSWRFCNLLIVAQALGGLLAMAQSDGKRARLRAAELHQPGLIDRLLHVGNVSNKGLLKILSIVRQELDLPIHATPWELDAAAQARFNIVRTCIHMPLVGGGTFDWHLCDPNALLARMVEDSPCLSELYMRAVSTNPPSFERPWTLLIGFDEFSPGDKFSCNNLRKSMMLNFSFLELGRAALSTDLCWFTPVCVRTQKISKVRGGWSHMLRLYLRLQLLGPSGLTTAGTPIMLNGKAVLIYAKLRCVVADGDGLRLALDWVGASGLRPCWKHNNVMKKDSDLASRSANFVEIDCWDTSRFRRSDSKDIATIVDLLKVAKAKVDAGTMTATRFKEYEQATGFHYNPDGLLADAELMAAFDVSTAFHYDWVHNMLQDGVFTVEAMRYIAAADDVRGLRMIELEEYLKDPGWRFPKHTQAKDQGLCRIFDAYRSRSVEESGKLKANASECLGLYSLLRHFIETRVDPAGLEAQTESYQAVCEVMDLILRIKHGLEPPGEGARKLRIATEGHLRKHTATYGSTFLKPKHHWNMDIADQIAWLLAVIDAFIIERLHLRAKSVMEPHLKNTSRYEITSLSAVLNTHHNQLQDRSDIDGGLEGSVARWPGSQNIRVADRMSYMGIHVSRGDVVFNKDAAGLVIACVEELIGDRCQYIAVVTVMEHIRVVSEHSGCWRVSAEQALWPAIVVVAAVAWYGAEDNLTVIRRS
jgi:hypothetical protein